jgi:RNA polymerase sigma-70 factor (ECF subfamily)
MDDLQNETRTNEDLMGRVGKKDNYAFETLVHRHQRPVLNFIYRFMGDHIEAEDLTQEVFLRVWKSAATYKPDAKFTTWLYRRKLFSISQSQKQKQDSARPFIPVENTGPATPENHLLDAERTRQLLDALGDLPANQRTAMVLKIYHGMSYREIAQIMDRSVSAVDSLLIRAKINLHKKLTKKK